MTERADRDAILDAARACFQIYGFKATTVEHIAERAGSSRTTVVRLVGGRNKLIDAVLVAEVNALLVDLAEAVDARGSLEDFIASVVREALLAIERRPLLQRAVGPDIVTVLPEATTEGLPMITALVVGGSALLGGVRDRFGLSHVDVTWFEELAEDLVRYILSLLHTPTMDGLNRDPEVAAARAARLFVPAFREAAHRARGADA